MRFDMDKFSLEKFWNDRFEPEFKLARNLEKEKGFAAAEPHYRKAYEGGNLLAGVRLGACYSAGHGYRADYPWAIRVFEDCMEKGSPLAAAMLAHLYFDGIGAERNEEKARELYSSCEEGLEELCREGYDEARYVRGLDLCLGTFGEKDVERGIDLVRKAADAGCVEACVEMGWRCFLGDGVDWDPHESSEYCKKAQNCGNLEAVILQSCIDLANGIPLELFVRQLTDTENRFAGDEKAGRVGHRTAVLHRLMGTLWEPCFEQGDEFGERALEHYCKALVGGQECLYDVAVLCFDHGLESRALPMDREGLLEQLKEAAREEEGASLAMLLGRVYDEGIVTPGNPKEAAAWYQRAFEKTGDKYAGFYLVKHYRGEGQPERAFRLLVDMADEGFPEAVYCLALAFRDGNGTEPDEGKARKYLEQAAQNGYRKARRILNRWESWTASDRKARFSGGAAFSGDACAKADLGRGPLETIRRQEELAAALQERYEDTGAEADGYALFDAQCVLGDSWLKLRRLMEARSVCKSLLELGEELELCFRTTRARRCLATGYEKLGAVDSSRVGDALFGARSYYIKARDLRKRLYAETGAAQDGRALAACYGLLGEDDSAFGEWETARDHYERARTICERIYEETEEAEDCCDLAKNYRMLGITYERLSKEYPQKRREYDAFAHACCKQSLELSEMAYAEAQTHGSKRNLAYSYMAMGDLAKRDGLLSATCRNCYEKSRVLFEELCDAGKTPEAGRDLFQIYTRLGWILDKQPEYFAYFVTALQIARQLYEEAPTLQAKSDLKKIYLIMGGICDAMGDKDKKAYYIESACSLTLDFDRDSQYYQNQTFAREFFVEDDPVIPFSELTGPYDSVEDLLSAQIQTSASAQGVVSTQGSACAQGSASAQKSAQQEPAQREAEGTKGKADYVDFNAARKTVICPGSFLMAVRNDGMVYCASKNRGYTGGGAAGWNDIVAIDVIGGEVPVGLRADGTVVVSEYGSAGPDLPYSMDWRDIVAIAAASVHLVGLKADGTVAALGSNWYYQCEVGDFRDIVQIGCGKRHTVGLRSDGTVMAAGRDDIGGYRSEFGYIAYEQDDPRRRGELLAQCKVGDWHDIEEIRVGSYVTFGRRSDGTWLLAAEDGDALKYADAGGMRNGVYSIEFDGDIIRLRADGTFEVEGDNHPEIREWTDIRLPENL